MDKLILCEVAGHMATLTLNRADKLNALTLEMLGQISAEIDALEANPDIRVIILGAAGDRAFSVGADIKAWAALEPLDMWRKWIVQGQRAFDRIADCRLPVIAKLHGYVLGGGLELAMAADIRIASDNARLALPEAKIATTPGWAGTQRLPNLIGVARAKQMVFTGMQIDAQQAERWGLVNEVVSAEILHARTDEIAAQIAANAPLSVQFSKQLLGGNRTLALEGLAGALAASSEDGHEGSAAFREKRTPIYHGR